MPLRRNNWTRWRSLLDCRSTPRRWDISSRAPQFCRSLPAAAGESATRSAPPREAGGDYENPACPTLPIMHLGEPKKACNNPLPLPPQERTKDYEDRVVRDTARCPFGSALLPFLVVVRHLQVQAFTCIE